MADAPTLAPPSQAQRNRAEANRAANNRTYVICASPRTGSTLLCSGLIRSGVAGRPRENFDDRDEVDAQYKARIGVDHDVAYLRKVLRLSKTPNGMRGLKIHWHQLWVLERMLRAVHEQVIVQQPELSFADLQRRLFGPVKWIWLRRQDKVAQAVSLYRASRSRIWHQPANKERRTGDELLEYDFAAINRLVHGCFKYDTNWSKYLALNNIQPLTLWYEEISGDYENSMARVFEFLELGKVPIEPPGLNRVSGTQSAEWIERFKREKAEHILKKGGQGLPLVMTGQSATPDQTRRADEE